MERYVFADPSRIPPGLHVIGVPTPSGFVWVEITAAEFDLRATTRTKATFTPGTGAIDTGFTGSVLELRYREASPGESRGAARTLAEPTVAIASVEWNDVRAVA